jgi:hypothetical protein
MQQVQACNIAAFAELHEPLCSATEYNFHTFGLPNLFTHYLCSPKMPSAEAVADAKALREAMKGFGTNDKVNQILIPSGREKN